MLDTKAKNPYTILLVDDDKFLLDIYSLKFKDSGCVVEAMADPFKALEKLRSGYSPNIILLDIVMPSLNGFEFMEAVKKEGLAKGTAVIMLSNQGQQEDIDKAISLGAAGYIVKASSIPSEVLQKTLSIAQGIR